MTLDDSDITITLNLCAGTTIWEAYDRAIWLAVDKKHKVNFNFNNIPCEAAPGMHVNEGVAWYNGYMAALECKKITPRGQP